MKQLIFVLSAVFLLFTACQQTEEPVVYQVTGTVVDYAGTEHCRFVIELDNGHTIQPLHYPEGFKFIEGQRVLVDYIILPNVISTCDKGSACDLISVEEIGCGLPLTDLYTHDYNSLPNDPVYVHEVFIEGECLQMKVSFGGGCRIHVFDLARIHENNEEKRDIAYVELRHNANGDLCKAYLTKELRFNLSELKDEGITRLHFSALQENGETYSEVFDLEL
jgi:hypothetical protein